VSVFFLIRGGPLTTTPGNTPVSTALTAGVTLAFWLHHHSLLFNIAVDGKALGDSVGGMLLPSGMRKTFGSAFALIMVALFTVAPTSPATAYPGGIHLHIAGKVGQKAVGSTVIFGAEGLTQAPQPNSFYSDSVAVGTMVPNACLWLVQANKYGELGYPLEPKISGWTSECKWGETDSGKQI